MKLPFRGPTSYPAYDNMSNTLRDDPYLQQNVQYGMSPSQHYDIGSRQQTPMGFTSALNDVYGQPNNTARNVPSSSTYPAYDNMSNTLRDDPYLQQNVQHGISSLQHYNIGSRQQTPMGFTSALNDVYGQPNNMKSAKI